jgi:N6-adenosine-specific RNA methylase IME4
MNKPVEQTRNNTNLPTLQAKRERRAQRERELAAKITALPGGQRYGVGLADPGWRFVVRSDETGRDRSAENHYLTLDTAEIKRLPVGELFHRDAALFLWATVPMLPQALEVLQAWDFTYKSGVCWDKVVDGTGFWFRNRHELLLLGVRGRVPAPAPGTQWSSLIVERKRGHSVKPEASYRLIESYFQTLPKIELFCRGIPRPGWAGWGNEYVNDALPIAAE